MKIFKYPYFVAFFILVLLMHPLYMEQSVYEWLYKSGWENKIARVEVINLDAHTIQVLDNEKNIKIEYLDDCIREKEDEKNCTIVELPISRVWESYDISFKAEGNGKNQIRFMAPQNLEEGIGNSPVLVDYKDVYVNGKKLSIQEISLWYDYPYDSPIYDVKDGQTISFSFSARQHHMKIDDLKLLYKTFSKSEISSIWILIGTIIAVIYSLILIYLRHFQYLFCFIVFVFLSLPFVFISKKDISEQENRSLRKFPVLFTDGKINERYGLDLDSWFSDRFGGRKLFIDSRFFILYHINNKIANEKAFMGDDGWLFPTKGIKNLPSISDQHNENMKVVNALKKMGNFMKEKNVQIYLILEPSRSLLYKKYWNDYYPVTEYIKYIEELKTELKDTKNVHFIDLKDIFEKNKDKVQLYEKNDPHMTLRAVNLMMDKIISELDKGVYEQYKKSVIYNDSNCKLFSFLNFYDDFLGISSIQNNETCKKAIIESNNMKIIEKDIGLQEGVVAKPYINKDLYILFPCYGDYLFPILGEFYAHTTAINYNAFEKHDEEKLKNTALTKLRSVKPETIVLIFLSYPTEYNISKSNVYLEAF